jgi:CubicO group peptidase (beta-lactamase class C family)
MHMLRGSISLSKQIWKAPNIWGFFFLAVFVIGGLSCKNEASRRAEVIEVIEHEPSEIAFSTSTNARITSYFDSLSRYQHFNGVALFYHSDSIFRYKNGSPRIAEKDTFQFDDAFQLASVSKPITAFGLLHLLEQQHISVQTPVADILPLFSNKEITLFQLLTHTSGIGNYLYMTDSLWANPDSIITNAEVQCYFEEDLIPTYHSPGKTYDYCNSNYALIASIIEQISGRFFADYMRDEIFSPIGMINSDYMNPKEKTCLDYKVYGHYPSGDKKYPFYLNGVVGDKGLYSSVNDLFLFYQQLQNPTLVSDSLLQLAMSPLVAANHHTHYGLGWRSKQIETDRLVFHNGWWRGFRTYFWFNQEKTKCVIVLTNTIKGGYLHQEEVWDLF